MRIFYSITDAWPAYRVDIKELFGEALAARGLHTEWFMARGEGQATAVAYMGQPAALPLSLPTTWPLAGMLNRLLFILADCWHVLRAFASRRIQLVQCRDQFVAASLAAVLARLTGKPFVYWCSYPFPEHHIDAGQLRGGFKGGLQRLKGHTESFVLYRFVMRLATHSFVQSEQMLRDIAGYGVPTERMTPVVMGVPERLLEWARRQVAHPVPGRVVYLGTLGAARRLEMLIEAFALLRQRVPHATLLMVGDGDYAYERSNLEMLARQMGLSDAISFTGFLPIEDAWAYARSAAVCVSPIFPSRVLRAGSPTKLFEYMALGRPVVCNTHPDQTHVINESGAGLCVQWDSSSFAEAMAWCLENFVEAEAMGAKGPGWVAATRSYSSIADAVLKKYDGILRGKL